MFTLSNQKYLTYFKSYLESRSKEVGYSVNVLPVIGLVVAPIILITGLAGITETPFALIPALGGLVLGAISFSKLRKKESAELVALRQALNIYNTTNENRRLHKHLDRTAAQLLDASAYYWIRIREMLNQPPWSNPSLVLHYQNLRKEILAASDSAMDEASILLVRCIGTPKDTKSKDFQQVMDDLADFDLDDAFKGLKSILKSDTSKYTFQSINIGAVFEPTRNLAEKLKLLNAEVEDMTKSLLQAETGVAMAVPTGSSGIDTVLNTIRATKIAEEELDETVIRNRMGQ